jgi:hypothetical protein
MPAIEDLSSFDRDVACGATALSEWRADIAREPDEYGDSDPLAIVRHVAGRSAWEALIALAPSAHESPLRAALLPWVYALTQARIARGDDVALARAEAQAHASVQGVRLQQVNWREAWRGIAASAAPALARRWLDAAAELAPKLADIARSRAARRVEVARRLGLEHVWEPLVAVAPRVLATLAVRFLDATEDLSRAILRGLDTDETGAAAVLHTCVGRDAAEGWPARLTARWVDETFPEGARTLRLKLPQLPIALGAASFARALCALGFQVRVSASPSSMPFALAREPAFTAAHRMGFVFGALAADPGWQLRALGIGRRTALAQARSLARTALIEARSQAVRLLLGDDAAFAPRDRFEELGTRLFGAPLDPRFRGAWPRARDDEPARFLALLEAETLLASLRERFDVDWFRNPRAWSAFSACGAGPVREPVDSNALGGKVDSLARAFESSLG